MNYLHAFHAGNFADLVKHAALLQLLADAQRDSAPLTVLDTHAGRGLYDLAAPEARRSGEAEAGVGRLMVAKDAPRELAALIAAVQRLNPQGGVRRYPGSPWLAAEALRPQDSYVGWELRPSELAALRQALQQWANALPLRDDGFAGAVERCPRSGRVLALIDPPFERADDYSRTVATLAALRDRNPAVRALVWLPLKDLETFDAFLRDLEDAVAGPILVGEARMRPLSDPMRMNGCAVVALGAAERFSGDLARICDWIARTLGESGGLGRAYRL